MERWLCAFVFSSFSQRKAGKLDVVHLQGDRPFRDVEGCLSLSLRRFKLIVEISWALGSLAVFMFLKVFYDSKSMLESLAYLSPDGVRMHGEGSWIRTSEPWCVSSHPWLRWFHGNSTRIGCLVILMNGLQASLCRWLSFSLASGPRGWGWHEGQGCRCSRTASRRDWRSLAVIGVKGIDLTILHPSRKDHAVYFDSARPRESPVVLFEGHVLLFPCVHVFSTFLLRVFFVIISRWEASESRRNSPKCFNCAFRMRLQTNIQIVLVLDPALFHRCLASDPRPKKLKLARMVILQMPQKSPWKKRLKKLGCDQFKCP